MLSQEVVVLRYKDLGSNKMAFTTLTSYCQVTIQPLDTYKTSIDDGVYGKMFVGYTDGDVTLLVGDKLKDDDSNYYTVRSGGVTSRQYGRIGFIKVVLELTSK